MVPERDMTSNVIARRKKIIPANLKLIGKTGAYSERSSASDVIAFEKKAQASPRNEESTGTSEKIITKGQRYITARRSGVKIIFESGETTASSPKDSQITGKENMIGTQPNTRRENNLTNGLRISGKEAAYLSSFSDNGEAISRIP